MPNLRSAIEKADAERAREAEQSKVRQRQYELDKQKQVETYNQEIKRKTLEADNQFESVIMPIFKEVIAAKKIDISADPFMRIAEPNVNSNPLEKLLYIKKRSIESVPQQPGFKKTSYAIDRTDTTFFEGGKLIYTFERVVVTGTVYWDIHTWNPKTGYGYEEKHWNYLSIGITNDGLIISDFYPKIIASEGNNLQGLWDKVEDMMVRGNYQRGYRDDRPQSP